MNFSLTAAGRPFFVMAGLVPAIHVSAASPTDPKWMPGTSPENFGFVFTNILT